MRGSPLILTLVVSVLLALAGIPVWSLTRPHKHEVPIKTPDPATLSTRSIDLVITSTAAVEVELRMADKVVWRSGEAGQSFAASLNLPGETSAWELVSQVKWAASPSPQAARFQFSYDGETLADTTVWGQTLTEEVIVLSNPQPPR